MTLIMRHYTSTHPFRKPCEGLRHNLRSRFLRYQTGLLKIVICTAVDISYRALFLGMKTGRFSLSSADRCKGACVSDLSTAVVLMSTADDLLLGGVNLLGYSLLTSM